MPKIALAQINSTVGDLLGNKKKILDYIRRAESNFVDIIVFPELSLCGYPPEDLVLKDHFVSDNIKTLKEIIEKINKITVIIGFVDIDKNKNLYNAAAVIQNRKIKYIYHKEKLPNYGVFDEKRYFKEGNNKKTIIKIKDTNIGINICEDIWVNDGIYLKQAKKGAEVIINLSSSHYEVNKQKKRNSLLVTRAKQTGCYICYANLVGGQDELVFDGNSLVLGPSGKIISHGKHCEEDLIIADIPDQEKINFKFKEITKSESIYKVLVLGTRDYIVKNGFKKVVMGLSGGIDSSLVACIAVDAVGKENVIGVSMPSKFNSQETRNDSKFLAKNLGINFLEISIEEVFKSYLKALSKLFKNLSSDATEENLQARIRGNYLMALSNKFGWLVLTTGNKSELAVGYCTLYGDMSGGFAVIKDVPKTLVYELARYVNKNKELIPLEIIKRAPSAELRYNQKDQDSLPPYDVLDVLLKDYVEQHKSFSKIKKEISNEDTIKRVIKMVDYSEYKRRQSPPGVKITSRAFGRDWRLPITNKYKEFQS